MSIPAWLPPTINVDFHSDVEWNRLILRLYQLFKHDFIDNKPHLQSIIISFDERKIDSPFEEGFWHVIQRGKDYRTFDKQRSKRLPWCKPIIENVSDREVLCWNYLEDNNRIRTYLWLKDYDYIVILEKRKYSYILITAFWVDGPGSVRNYEGKYAKRLL
jgi:hypothetical protein